MFQDLRVAWRVLSRKPGFAIFAVSLIALGIGANTAVFSILNAVLLRPLPFYEPDRLVVIGFQNAERIQYRIPDEAFRAWQDRTQTIETITSWRDRSGEFTIGGETDRVSGEQVSANFFDLLGVRPMVGRGFLPAEELPGADPVIVVSYRFWQQRLGGDPEVLGRVVYHDGMPFTIVGVMPPELFGPMVRKHHEFWTPTHDPIREFYGHNLFARVKPGVEFQQAEDELQQLARGIEIEGGTGEWTPTLTPLTEFLTDFTAAALVVLMLAVGAVLVMACANLAQLLLARSQARVREFAARKALGATPWRVFRHVFSEGFLLAVAGASAGILLAYWLVPLMLAVAPNLPSIDETRIDSRVLAFCMLATLFTTVLFSLAPGLRLARLSVSNALRGGVRGPVAARLKAGSVLLVVQVGVSLVLLVSAGLLMQTFLKLLPTDPGFDHSGLLTQIVLDETRYPDDAARISFVRELLGNLEARPEIEAVALSSHIPFGWNVATVSYRRPGERTGAEVQRRRLFRHLISAGFFQVMGIPLLQGRSFTTADRGSVPAVAIVNEAFAQRLSPDGTVVGQNLFVEDNQGDETPREIVGIVANTRTHGRSTSTRESLYLPFEQQANRSFFILLHTRFGLDALLPVIREQVRRVDPAQPLREVQAYENLLWESVSSQRFRAMLVGIFSALALLVAIVGLFGLISYSLAQRTPEFGVRLAVGADGRDLVRLLLRQGARLAAVGIALGVGASLFATRLLESQLYELSPSDPLTVAAAAGLLGVAALAACYLPARRAAKIDPIEALRHE